MTKPLIDLPSNSPSPLCVHINRNGFKESLHQVDVAVCDADGSVILGMGDLESVIFPRSAMKPLQSIALIELSKTLEDIPEFSDAEVSLICASHNGELLHTEAVRGLLSKLIYQWTSLFAVHTGRCIRRQWCRRSEAWINLIGSIIIVVANMLVC